MARRPHIQDLLRGLLKEGRRLFLAFDNDKAGYMAVQAIFEAGLVVEGFFIPPLECDLNDVLREGGTLRDIYVQQESKLKEVINE